MLHSGAETIDIPRRAFCSTLLLPTDAASTIKEWGQKNIQHDRVGYSIVTILLALNRCRSSTPKATKRAN